MKSLSESLFDSKTQMTESLFDTDLATKEIKLGELFEFKYNTPFKTKSIIDSFFTEALKRDTKVKGRDKFDIIIKGLRKIIENIPIIGSESDEILQNKISALIYPYLKTTLPIDASVKVYEGGQPIKSFNCLNEIDLLAVFILSKVGIFYKRN